MQAVILAGGKGERMRPLTNTTPKPLIVVGGKPILFHILEALPEKIDEVFIVVNYLGVEIKKAIAGYDVKGKIIICVEQGTENGTFAALTSAKQDLNDSFLVVNGDSLYSKPDLEALCNCPLSILIRKESWPSEKTAVCFFDSKMRLTKIYEKVPNLKYKYANCGGYVLSSAIFNEPIVSGPSGESWLSAMVGSFASRTPIQGVVAKQYYTITLIEDIKEAEREFFNIIKNR